jgi:hypothetical protein
MRAAIRHFHSPDVDDLVHWKPANPRFFGFLLQALIGPADVPDAMESFAFVVCSPAWLEQRQGVADVLFARHHVILKVYDWQRLERAIIGIVDSVEEATWTLVAERIGRYGRWEFEDYEGRLGTSEVRG